MLFTPLTKFITFITLLFIYILLKTSVYGPQHFYRYKIFLENLLQMWEGVF